MRKISLFVIVCVSLTLAQHGFERREDSGGKRRPHFISYETHVLPSKKSSTVYYAYRVPYRFLIFLKDGSEFQAHFRLSFEVYDFKDKFVKRQILQKDISASEFDDTQADNTYYQGVTSFELPDGKYSVLPLFQDLNTDREIKLQPAEINTFDSSGTGIIQPLIVSGEKDVCGEGIADVLANFDGVIPFSDKPYTLIFPVKDTSVKMIHLTILSMKDTVYNSEISNSTVSGLSLRKCGSGIAVENSSSGAATRNFIAKGITGKLPEGKLIINAGYGPVALKHKRFMTSTRWINKPISLINPEDAIKLLKYMTSDSTVSKMLDADSDLYEKELFKFWRKYDPTPSTEFNPLMSEYYTRADYANRHFRYLSGKGGVDSDRGKVYLIYGKPEDIIRASDDLGRVVEKWVYSKLKRQFVFIDKNGSGNFVLE